MCVAPRLITKRKSLLTDLPLFTDQVAAAIEGFFWPKIFWDFLTKNLDGAVKPVPALQILNLVLGLVGLAWEWPLSFIADTRLHRSIEARLAVYPISVVVAVLLYQGTNAALYYMIGMAVYVWAYSEGEVSCECRSRGFVDAADVSLRLSAANHGHYQSVAAGPGYEIVSRLHLICRGGFHWV